MEPGSVDRGDQTNSQHLHDHHRAAREEGGDGDEEARGEAYFGRSAAIFVSHSAIFSGS